MITKIRKEQLEELSKIYGKDSLVMEMYNDLLKEIEILKKQLDVSRQSCSHPDKYFVHGVFGGYWCPKCDRNVDDDCEQTLR